MMVIYRLGNCLPSRLSGFHILRQLNTHIGSNDDHSGGNNSDARCSSHSTDTVGNSHRDDTHNNPDSQPQSDSICAATSAPSTPGIIRSRRVRSGLKLRAVSTAPAASFSSQTTYWPDCCRISRALLLNRGLSFTIRMRGLLLLRIADVNGVIMVDSFLHRIRYTSDTSRKAAV